MFQDEAGFGRINKPKYCWCKKGHRPSVPCHHIREYRYAYGAVEPRTGDSFFFVMPYCDTKCMNVFLQELSKAFPDDFILLVCDGARWHKSACLCVPDNIQITATYMVDGDVVFVNADWKGQTDIECYAQWINVQGRIYNNQNYNIPNGGCTIETPKENGLYLLRVVTGKGRRSFKFMIQKKNN